MGYLIDGNNVLGHLFPGEIRDPRSRYALVFRLLAFQKVRRARLDLVFDGPADGDLARVHSQGKKFFVHFAAPGQSADDVIKELIVRQTDLRRFFVELKRALRERRAAAEMEKKTTTLSPFEIGLWLDTFRKKNG
jgi:predicted RNA-binding protein with PIN domain